MRPSIHWLLVCIPLAFALEHNGAPAPAIFACAALALLPLATLIVHSTEQIAARTGPAIGGLLNATFGNLPELIIAFAALRAGLTDMVRGSLVGALMANLLLAQGLSFLLGGRLRHEQQFNPEAARTYSSMMLLTALCLAVPASFHRFFSEQESSLVASRGASLDLAVAILLLALYGLYLVFMLRSHPDFFAPRDVSARGEAVHGEVAHGSQTRAAITLVLASVGAAWTSEMLVGAAQATGSALGMSDLFLGIVVLATLGGAAELAAAVAMARKDQMDLSVGIAMGSSIQIGLFVTPVLVLVSGLLPAGRMSLDFSRLEIGVIICSVLVGIVVSSDGRANWFKGVQLLALYLVIAALLYVLPS
jgi:Ca2+:H+ antiporter